MSRSTTGIIVRCAYQRIDRPTEPGLYWYRETSSAGWSWRHVHELWTGKLYADTVGQYGQFVDAMRGQWRGPIPPPPTQE